MTGQFANPGRFYTGHEARAIQHAWDLLTGAVGHAKGVTEGKAKLKHGLKVERLSMGSGNAGKAIILHAWLIGWDEPNGPIWRLAGLSEGCHTGVMLGAAMRKFGNYITLPAAARAAVEAHEARQARQPQ